MTNLYTCRGEWSTVRAGRAGGGELVPVIADHRAAHVVAAIREWRARVAGVGLLQFQRQFVTEPTIVTCSGVQQAAGCGDDGEQPGDGIGDGLGVGVGVGSPTAHGPTSLWYGQFTSPLFRVAQMPTLVSVTKHTPDGLSQLPAG